MSIKRIKLHQRVAEQLERAARHHRTAAECYEAGDYEFGRHHASMAEGYCNDLAHLAEALGEELRNNLLARDQGI